MVLYVLITSTGGLLILFVATLVTHRESAAARQQPNQGLFHSKFVPIRTIFLNWVDGMLGGHNRE